ncbi:C2H2 finger domain-containing protein [Lasiosphaeria hispida]|uniref:RING-type E3 ubiquitin transferase n=1 Tax=Lasiosphaeria hispida TaxID=260671 RepID=A0AAJ0MAQ0_9PEZI|nr:C2H2 finger domain-containing protein [Lasiosphaeria hispida]
MASTEGTRTADDGGASNPTASSHPRGEGQRGRGRGREGPRGRGRGDGSRGGPGRGRGRGGGDRGGHSHAPNAAAEPANEAVAPAQPNKPQPFKTRNEPQDDASDDDAEVCFICANPVSHYSVAPCNHSTCHICALRLRALYKSKECPHCRTVAPYVIFTDDGTKKFEEYKSSEITSTDDNIGIQYTSEDIVGDSVLLLRYNCPDLDCEYAGLGWPDLHRHVRTVHKMKMCDLCARNKKVFTHEHDLYNDKDLGDHMKHGNTKTGEEATGFRGHPLCGFCGERFYDDDKLYEHCRNKHERCFICDRRDSRKPHYYRDYNALEEHFKNDHHICLDRECLEKKFVVFESDVDLKAHQLSEHADSLSKDVRRDARHVDMSNFDFRQSYQQERRGGGGGGSGGRDQQRRRQPDPNSEPLPVSSAQPLRRDELAFQRQMAITSAQASRPGQAPRPNPIPSNQQAQQPRVPPQQPMVDAMQNITISDLSSLTPEQRASLTRHGAVIERASNLLGTDTSKVNTFRSYISNYNKGSMTSEQLIDAFFALFSETSTTALGTLVREVADLFDDKRKAEALRKAWQNWRAINEDYPSLPTLGGMHGVTTASSGWAAAAAATPTIAQSSNQNPAVQLRHTTRVLKLKNSTRRGSASSAVSAGAASNSSASDNWAPNRPAASSSSAAFPALPGAQGSARPLQPSWIGGASGASKSIMGTPPPVPRSVPAATGGYGSAAGGGAGPRRTGGGGGRGGAAGEDAFPALPAAPKPQTTIFGYGRGAVRRDIGTGRETGFNWGGGGSGSGADAGASANADAANEEAAAGGKGKKKNKKQVLVQWG